MTFYTVDTSVGEISLSLESIQALIIQADRIELLFNKAWIWTTDQQLFSVAIDTWNQIQQDIRDKKIDNILKK